MVTARIRQLPTAAIAAAGALVWLVSAAVMVHFGRTWHLDLRVYRDAGHALVHGGSPFRQDFTASDLPFTYTPFALLVLCPLSFIPLGPAAALWWLVSAAALVATVYLVLTSMTGLPARRALAVAALLGAVSTLALEPVRSNMDYGQINLILMLLVVADITRVRGAWRGVLVGVAASIKLTPLVYLGYFAVARDRRSLLRGAGTFVVLTALSWAVLPADSSLYWFHEVTDAGRTGPVGSVSNQSWNGLLHRAPFHAGHLASLLWLVLALATLAVGLVLAGRLVAAGQTARAVFALALTELLVSPISWSHHWSWLVLAPIMAVSLWRQQRAVAWCMVALVVLGVAAPYWWLGTGRGPLSFVAGNSLVLAGAVTLVVWVVSVRRSGALREDGPGELPRSADSLQ